jgi:hypothetical protein
MKTLLFFLAATAVSATPALAASYEQGICDGIRATEAHPPTANIGIIAEGRTQRYFRCNGTSPTDPTGPTVFVKPAGGLGHR